jgi:hypothetical protein
MVGLEENLCTARRRIEQFKALTVPPSNLGYVFDGFGYILEYS